MVQEEEFMIAAKGGSVKTMLISLAIAIVLLIGLLIGAFALGDNQQTATDDDLIPLIDCREEDINKITIENKRDSYTIKRDGIKGGVIQWIIENQDNTDVDLFSLKTIANRCYKLNARRDLGVIDVTDKELLDTYGLGENAARVTIDYVDGVRTFVVGDAYGAEFYMYELGTGKFYTAPNTVGTYFNLASNELRELPSLTVSMGNIGVVSLSRKGRESINFAFIPSIMSETRAWQMVSPVGGYTDGTVVNELLEAISNFSMNLYIAPSLGDDLEKYGFDDPYATMVLAPFIVDEEDKDVLEDTTSQVVFVGDPVPEIAGYRYCYTYAVKEGEEVDTKECRVYAITDEQFESIFGVKAINLLDKQVVLTNIENVKSIDLQIMDKTASISITKKDILDDDGNPILDASGNKQVNTYFKLEDGTEIDESNARAFYLKLISLKVVAFLRDDDPQEIGEKMFSMTLHTDIKVFGREEADLYATVTAEVYELDSNYCVIRFRGQEENVCKMYRSQMLEIIEAYDLMLKGELPPIRGD